jgi:hypothetical protein
VLEDAYGEYEVALRRMHKNVARVFTRVRARVGRVLTAGDGSPIRSGRDMVTTDFSIYGIASAAHRRCSPEFTRPAAVSGGPVGVLVDRSARETATIGSCCKDGARRARLVRGRADGVFDDWIGESGEDNVAGAEGRADTVESATSTAATIDQPLSVTRRCGWHSHNGPTRSCHGEKLG